MIESWVDLTYRGISLGRRVKLADVRPSNGYLELASPMPVGSELMIVADEGLTIAATVAWVHEQVAGADRAPGMGVVPRLVGEPQSAWWRARVALPDEPQPTSRLPRNKPVTVRPRTHSQPVPATASARAGDMPAIVADLAARVSAAAGVQPAPAASEPPAASAMPQPLVEPVPPPAESRTRTDREPAMRTTGEHAVIDDGYATVIMEAIDPQSLGIDGRPVDANGGDGATDPEGVRHRDEPS